MTESSNGYELEPAQRFLSDSFLLEANRIVHLPEDILDAFAKAFSLIRSSTELTHLAWDVHVKLSLEYEQKLDEEIVWPKQPLLKSLMGDQDGMFAAVVLLTGLPKTIEKYRSRGIPLQILTETISDLEIWMRHYHKRYGAWGLAEHNWLKNHMAARLFRLGRLQFICDKSSYKIQVYRNTESGQVIAFPAADTRFKSNGQIRTNVNDDPDDGWTARFEVTETEIHGNPLSSSGYAIHQTISLPKAFWKLILKEGDSVLHVHIAEGNKLTHELCRASYQKALQFYKEYFPETTFSAFACGSWLLNPEFNRLLPESSNIVRFQKDFNLFPIVSQEQETLWRVFGVREIDWEKAPRDTLLQRVILDQAAQGNRMYGGAGFIPREDAEDGTFARHYAKLEELLL